MEGCIRGCRVHPHSGGCGIHEKVCGPHLDVRCGHERCRRVRELNRALGDIPHVRDCCEIVGGKDLDETHFDPLTHDVPVDGENIRRVYTDVKIGAYRKGMFWAGIRDPDIRNSLEPGGTKGRVLYIEVPVKTITEMCHSYYRGSFF